jgi:hypothetical protein
MFVADNNGFDWQFINWHFLGRNSFGFSSMNLGSLYKGLMKDTFANFKHLRKRRHTHHPVDDAMGNAEARSQRHSTSSRRISSLSRIGYEASQAWPVLVQVVTAAAQRSYDVNCPRYEQSPIEVTREEHHRLSRSCLRATQAELVS